MNDDARLHLSKKLREACEGFGMRYVGGGYGNVNDKPGNPFEFRMNFLCGGEKITVSLNGDGDFESGPFTDTR